MGPVLRERKRSEISLMIVPRGAQGTFISRYVRQGSNTECYVT